MTPPIGFEAGTATHTITHSSTIPGIVPDPPMVGYGELGYSRGLIKQSANGHDYVDRKCEGCGVELEFEPRPGFKRLESCKRCGRFTSWRLVV
jgi:hypothetical protein